MLLLARIISSLFQNYRVYIGPLYVRQLNDNEKAELDEYDIKVKEYKEKAIENMKRVRLLVILSRELSLSPKLSL